MPACRPLPTRRRLLAAVGGTLPLAAAHLPCPGIGRLRRSGDGFAFGPVPRQLH